ncbi:MAG TPA: biotin--[acetyl-CoA-carboxylase] ligase [Candidatus Mcinerneyibacteriales bacterium]|nr:biotin--[acetyl-CoA-carboxylase] ligase [Candidatus Mcinerneyibacteriales bacterium]HPJ70065.1 biotin--[acetyl-CoA-carboxylase] ligase [Candidatus Mcinerneyibacteriales bacterium]HPQ89087.1 biotin--[acetyl-CoA-carboxylase] ligase [Candidatus Mcinerneyibacteriales bacterium]
MILEERQVTSTNDRAEEWLRSHGTGDLPSFFRADEQTSGKGRRGRFWASPPGGLYMTAVFKAPDERESLLHPLRCAALIHRSLKALGVRELKIKWPNDLYAGRRKLGGLLSRRIVLGGQGVLLVGIGINVRKNLLPSEAVSLEEIMGCKKIAPSELFYSWTDLLQKELSRAETVEYLNAHLWSRGEYARLKTPGGELTARILKVDEDLSLSVMSEEGKRERLLLGEIL